MDLTGSKKQRVAALALGRDHMRSWAECVTALGLQGRAVFAEADDGSVRAFVPAAKDEDVVVPTLSPGRVLHRDRPGSLGVSFVPPGAALFEAARIGPQRGSPEAWAAALRHGDLRAVVGRVEVSTTAGRVRATYRPTWTLPLCEEAHGVLAPWHLQGCCPSCAVIGMSAARFLGRPVQVLSSVLEAGELRLELRTLDR